MSPTKEEVMKQIERLFSNTSVPAEETLQDLNEIRDQVDGLIDNLESDCG